jgi:hypothetical protein
MAVQPETAHAARTQAVELSDVDLELADVHRLSSEEYHRLIEAGAFEDWPRVELIEGLLCDMNARGREHELKVEHLIWRFSKSLDGRRYRLRAAEGAC